MKLSKDFNYAIERMESLIGYLDFDSYAKIIEHEQSINRIIEKSCVVFAREDILKG